MPLPPAPIQAAILPASAARDVASASPAPAVSAQTSLASPIAPRLARRRAPRLLGGRGPRGRARLGVGPPCDGRNHSHVSAPRKRMQASFAIAIALLAFASSVAALAVLWTPHASLGFGIAGRTVTGVAPSSVAARDGIRAGDTLQ